MYWWQLLTVAGVHLLAVMSPGPDFIMISRNALVYSRRTGIYSALGLAAGITVHITYCLLGVGLLISKSILLFNVIKFIGAGYLIYIGYKSLRAKKAQGITVEAEQPMKHMSPIAAVRMGFLTNVLNPKATLFFLALFTQIITPHTPLGFQLLYGVEMIVATFLWFSFVAIVLSHGVVKRQFAKVQHRFEQVFGIILIGLGIKVALTSAK